MSPTGSSSLSALGAVIRVLLVFDAVALLLAAALHVNGASLRLGFASFDEPPLLPAAIAEGLAGLLFVISAYAVFSVKGWAWTSAVVAHTFAILAFVVGIVSTRNGMSPFNFAYHRVMLAIFVLGLILLLVPAAQAALGRGRRAQPRTEA